MSSSSFFDSVPCVVAPRYSTDGLVTVCFRLPCLDITLLETGGPVERGGGWVSGFVGGGSISQHHDVVIMALRPWCCETTPPSDKGITMINGLGRAPSESRSST